MDTYTVIGGQFVNDSESEDSPADKPFRVSLESESGEKREIILSGDDLNKVKIGKKYRIAEDGTLRRVVHVVAAVICKDGKVFATQRAQLQHSLQLGETSGMYFDCYVRMIRLYDLEMHPI